MKKQVKQVVKPCTFEITPPVHAVGPRVVTPCKEPAQANGYCTVHQHAAQLLALAEQCHYPRIELEFLAVGRGVTAWQAYCERATREHAKTMEHALRAWYRETFGRVA